jgi:hypothetical protein
MIPQVLWRGAEQGVPAMQRQACPVFHCSRRNYARDLRPAGSANTEAEARLILMRVFEGIHAETSIEVKLAPPAS